MNENTSTEAETVDFDETTQGPPQGREEAPAETEGTTEAPEGTEGEEETTEDDSPGREAARYRRKLRAAEKERDQLSETVATLRRAEVERIAASQIATPSALWAAGVELETLLGEDGTPDPDKVRVATAEVAQRLGLAQPGHSNYVAREGTNPSSSRGGTMVDAVMGR